MKLYYAPGVCSLAPHIVAREAGIEIELIKVDIRAHPQSTADGGDYSQVNPKGSVPALEIQPGVLLTEGAVLVQYLADRAPESGLAPAAGTLERYRLQEWLNFIATELHKMFSPWLFHPEYGTEPMKIAREKIAARFSLLDEHLDGPDFLMGAEFTAADAYCFAVVRWSKLHNISLDAYPNLRAYMERVAARPAVAEAMAAEGLTWGGI